LGGFSLFNRILVAVDGSQMGEKALKSALLLAKERYSKVGVIHVKKNVNVTEAMTKETVDEIHEAMKKEGDELLHHVESIADEKDIEIESHLVMGDPAIQIVKMADEGNYQVIVMGSRGLGAIKGLMLGSVSHKVSQLSHCPVLIVK
jgi:nucleotide-binding universal stress UspA family protein